MQKIGVLDFGGQYAHLLANRVRRIGVFSEIVSPRASLESLKEYQGLIFSGGPSSVYLENAPDFNADILNFDGPILGICYGHQIITHTLGGTVKPGEVKEYGTAKLQVQDKSCAIFGDLGEDEIMWMSHGDSVSAIPDGFKVTATTADCPVAAMAHESKPIFGLQFHPEVTHSENGMSILENFLKVCGCDFNWNLEQYLEDSLTGIRKQCGDKKVFLLVSGGVDSNVAFALLNKAIGPENVYGLHVDNGLMRKDESAWVKAELHKCGFDNFHVVDAGETFLKNLEGAFEPQNKRVIIGDTFLDVKDTAVETIPGVDDTWLLGQGTIYPDTIESGGTENAEVIKTHHNRVDRVNELIAQGKVIEPLADLYKDEVRALGELLGLPHKLVWRHPFPGPGLGVRVLCSDGSGNEDFSDLDSEINAFLAEKYEGLSARVLPIKSVGVQGDARTYAHPCLISGEADWDQLEDIATTICNRFAKVNRVIYNIGGKKAEGTTSLKKCFITKDRLDILRDADQQVTDFMYEHNLYEEIWQKPVALIPVAFTEGSESIVLRPINSTEAMTANFARIPRNLLPGLVERIRKAAPSIDGIWYDVTNKPPGTIEWE